MPSLFFSFKIFIFPLYALTDVSTIDSETKGLLERNVVVSQCRESHAPQVYKNCRSMEWCTWICNMEQRFCAFGPLISDYAPFLAIYQFALETKSGLQEWRNPGFTQLPAGTPCTCYRAVSAAFLCRLFFECHFVFVPPSGLLAALIVFNPAAVAKFCCLSSETFS